MRWPLAIVYHRKTPFAGVSDTRREWQNGSDTMPTVDQFLAKYPNYEGSTECPLLDVPIGAEVVLIEKNETGRVLGALLPTQPRGSLRNVPPPFIVVSVEKKLGTPEQNSTPEPTDPMTLVRVIDLHDSRSV
jgi:hypothetical protein